MKGIIIFYRLITYILLPVAALLSFFGLFALIAAISNPALLLGVFMIAGIVIYTFTGFSFLSKGILEGKKCKPSLRDWIRVNAFVTIAFAFLSLSNAFMYFNDPNLFKDAMDNAAVVMHQFQGYKNISPEYMLQMMKATLYFMMVYSILLLIHIFITFRLLKQYAALFSGN